MSLEIRDAVPGDELDVAAVHVRSWQVAYDGLIDANYLAALSVENRARGYTFASNALEAPRTRLAYIEGQLNGFATTGPNRDIDGAGELLALYVDPPAWRRGVGAALIADARRALVERGFDSATLWVLRGNQRAVTFYERDGWTLDGTSRSEQWGEIRLDELRMSTDRLEP